MDCLWEKKLMLMGLIDEKNKFGKVHDTAFFKIPIKYSFTLLNGQCHEMWTPLFLNRFGKKLLFRKDIRGKRVSAQSLISLTRRINYFNFKK